jgi:hypothetical protein
MNKKTHGGYREGSGRHLKYGEVTETVAFACPISKKEIVQAEIQKLLVNWVVNRKKDDLQNR